MFLSIFRRGAKIFCKRASYLARLIRGREGKTRHDPGQTGDGSLPRGADGTFSMTAEAHGELAEFKCWGADEARGVQDQAVELDCMAANC